MASKQLVDRAIETFERLDIFSQISTAHALGAHSRPCLRVVFELQDDWTLEHVTIEEMEYDLAAAQPTPEA